MNDGEDLLDMRSEDAWRVGALRDGCKWWWWWMKEKKSRTGRGTGGARCGQLLPKSLANNESKVNCE